MYSHLSFSTRSFKTITHRYAKVIPSNLKGKSKSSQDWISRQLSDPYVERAKIKNYRCRSAFKLLEIDDKYKILKPGDVVIDCGAAPGSWTQVATERTNANESKKKKAKGAVFSIDLHHFHPIKGSTIFGGMDFTDEDSQLKLKTVIRERPVNCILSDMAPNATGIRVLDQENIINLCYSVFQFALNISAVGANLVVKVWDNSEVQKLEKHMLRFYRSVKRVKPKSSRSDSAELFVVAKSFTGLKF